MKTTLLLMASLFSAAPLFAAEPTSTARTAINTLGLDLLRKGAKPDANALLSPYSIQTALAMTYAGADGATRDEMAKVLHYPADEAAVHRSFSDLQKDLAGIMRRSAQRSEQRKSLGGSIDPIVLTVGNRLFAQQDYQFRDAFLTLTKDTYDAPLQPVDFKKDAAGVAQLINTWVEKQTKARIRNLISPDALSDRTRLVLVNAIYLKAPWEVPFQATATKPQPFHVKGGAGVGLPTMTQRHAFGYSKADGYTALTLPYSGGELQLLVLLPDDVNGLAALEARLSADQLPPCANLPSQDVILYLPKFKIESPSIPLGGQLQALGMMTAFDKPRASANFDRMAPRLPSDYLYISQVFHKTFMDLDEKGTEAAAATAVSMAAGSAMPVQRPRPIEVRVDHPFLFAIQHRATGACLFLGHITDPR
jgi:serpin B